MLLAENAKPQNPNPEPVNPPRVIPPSPEANSLGKFGNWPVSLYTGVPNISIPIYDVYMRGFSVPIQLSNHASGIKVEDVASWTGTGWTMEAGGAITRTVMGLPDESGLGYYWNRGQINTFPAIFDPSFTNETQYQLFNKIANNEFDTEPDVFYFNICGLSGRFMMDRDGVLRTMPASNVKIIRNPLFQGSTPQDRYWELLDDKGNTYILGRYNKYETSTSTYDVSISSNITAWYLSEIILANRIDTISFAYNNKLERYNMKVPETYRVPQHFPHTDPAFPEPTEYGYGFSNNTGIENSVTITGLSSLKEISWKYGKVSFYAGTQRNDIFDGVLLDSVKISNLAGPIKTFRFSYEYDYSQKRVYLKELKEMDQYSSSFKEPYRFEYNSGLPDRMSNSQDYWGYHNGANNTNLIPLDPNIMNYRVNLFVLPNANRNPSDEHMKQGTIRRIYYPTGGFTEFDFEANRYFGMSDPVSVPGYYETRYAYGSASLHTPTTRRSESIFNAASGPYSLTMNIDNYYRPPDAPDSWLPTMKLLKIEANGTETLIRKIDAFHQWEEATSRTVNGSSENLYFNIQGTIYTTLQEGKYKLIAEIANSGPTFPLVTMMNVTLSYNYYVNPQTEPGVVKEVLAGGLRIKNIKSYDHDSKLIGEKRYEYTKDSIVDGVVTKVSTGTLLSKPNMYSFYYQPVYCMPWGGTGTGICIDDRSLIATFTSNPNNILGQTQGGYVGYEEIKEIDGVEQNNGYTRYIYSSARDQSASIYYSSIYPSNAPIFLPVTDNEYRRGLLLQKEIRSKTDTGYKQVYFEKNTYDFNDQTGNPRYKGNSYLKVRRLADSLHHCCKIYSIASILEHRRHEFAYGYYALKSPWVHLQTKEVIQDGVRTITTYNYDSTSMLPSYESVVNSAGAVIAQTYKYPSNMVAEGADQEGAFAKMVARNILTPVIRSTKLKNGVELESTLIGYRDWLNNTNLLLPETITTTRQGISTIELQYKGYDVYGNVRGLQQIGGVLTSYYWDSSGEYPIARLDNGTPQQFFHENFEESTLSGVASGNAKGGSKYLASGSYLITFSRPDNKAYRLIYWKWINNSWQYVNEPYTTDNMLLNVGAPIDEVSVFPEGTSINTYTYRSLYGITSETNPSGQTVIYEYDGFGRLQYLRDQFRNIIKVIRYSYRQQE